MITRDGCKYAGAGLLGRKTGICRALRNTEYLPVRASLATATLMAEQEGEPRAIF